MKLTLPPVARLIGFRIVKNRKGAVTLALRTQKKHENTIGTVHGGILCDLSDAAMGYAFLTCLKPGQSGVTVEFKINFLKPVRAGETVLASGRVVSAGRSLYYLECEIRGRDRKLAAKASCTCKIARG